MLWQRLKRHCHHTELFTSETCPCRHVHQQDDQLGANFPYLSSTQQLWVWERVAVLRGFVLAAEVIQKHQHQLVPFSSLIWSPIFGKEIQQVNLCMSVSACMFKRPPALQQGSLSLGKEIVSTHTQRDHILQYVWFNPKRHIDPNGRVFVSPRPSLMLMSLWIIYLCVLFAFSSFSLKE